MSGISASPASTESSSTSVRNTSSYYSSTSGPWAVGYTSSWKQVIWPTIVGTVIITINEATNKTYSTTVYNSEFAVNGTSSILTRTDVNSAGTVTKVKRDAFGQNATVTYPTNVLDMQATVTWDALFPTLQPSSDACCAPSSTLYPRPSHTLFSFQGFTNTADPSGWLYGLIGAREYNDETVFLNPTNISSLYAPTSLGFPYSGCSYIMCKSYGVSSSYALGAVVVSEAAFLLATSTVTVSSGGVTAPTPAQAAGTPSPLPTQSTPDVSTASVGSDPSTSPSVVTSGPYAVNPASDLVSTVPDTTSPGSPSVNPVSNLASIIAHLTTQSTTPAAPSSLPRTVPTTTLSSSAQPSFNGQAASSGPSNVAGSILSQALSVEPQSAAQTTAPTSRSTINAQSSSSSADDSPLPLEPQPGDTSSESNSGPGSSEATSTLGDNTAAESSRIPAVPGPPVIVGSATISPDQSTRYVISGQTLAVGSSVNIGSGSSVTAVALQTDATATYLVVGSSTSTLPALVVSTSTLPAITIGSAVITANGVSGYAVGSETLSPGGPGITLSGTAIALQTDATATYLIVGSSTSTLSPPSISLTTPPVITVGSAVITPNSLTEYVVGSQTLSPGGQGIMLSGTAISLASGATEILIGSSTLLLSHPSLSPSMLPPITVGNVVVTANSQSQYIIGSQTLLQGGPPITVSGTAISMASGATEIIVGTQTEVATPGVGGYIWSALGSPGTASSAPDAASSGSASPTFSEAVAQSTSAAILLGIGWVRIPVLLITTTLAALW
ncbi:hypothetical protein LTR27_001851 [Elasticomyces elasticus]|nr:hypothetical protein LTR27_001851 [Elasticomyces elasticus]